VNKLAPTERLLAALRENGYEPKRSGSGWACRCPAHDDRNPSLSIGTGDDGRALVTCHAGCATADVLSAIGFRLADLMLPRKPHANRQSSGRRPVNTTTTNVAPNPGIGDVDTVTKLGATYATADAAIANLERRHGTANTTWTYTDAAGEPVGMILRWDTPTGKVIRPVSRNGARWTLRGMPAQRPLYALTEVLGSSAVVFICEGEKAADAVRACDLTATTSPHGSKSAGKADWSPLAGRDVVILPDNDDPARTTPRTWRHSPRMQTPNPSASRG